MSEELSREDLHAALGVRKEMGADIEPALVDSLARKIEATVERRFQAEMVASRQEAEAARAGQSGRIAVGIVSLVMAIPLTAISGSMSGFLGMLLVWTGIVLVNVAMALRRPRP
ncbi:hypothetical protein H5392_04160 [Tessaracoccus sp. MC1865]|uniref:hypothetical protein n=1 Tax=unclassified Tessaracoccus TaxID=2635419 RepID=UPI00096ED8D7|nr:MULTISPECIES: hypothetical protein [unclassified Tessaracoccus]MBB1483055.1 hypothetical protein [Tessaracoccus sp. MC1865]MBB1510896.1 hypothetical protein [Tessaracoccus sp. MC1756]MCG6567658.1 hypothetical protein [Tessaracoccus sp. ZS01]OMG55731.1 hypothetical protein BJN44_08490 [Tessaracoccus sp. ZS01]QTO37514.1 hypothetical protein J7D54_14055 [Tessaracoccus sp. MC1865]